MTASPVTPICAELLIGVAPSDLGIGTAESRCCRSMPASPATDHPDVPYSRVHARVVRHRSGTYARMPVADSPGARTRVPRRADAPARARSARGADGGATGEESRPLGASVRPIA